MIDRLQALLAQDGIPAWLFYDFRHSNPIAYRALGLGTGHRTRRWYYLLPASGRPIKIVSAIEAGALDALPGETRRYRTWQEREQLLGDALRGLGRVAMEYSARNAIPYVSTVDAGTVELVRSLGVAIVSSADLVQQAIVGWTDDQRASHQAAGKGLIAAKNDAWDAVRQAIRSGTTITDVDLQRLMVERFTAAGLETDAPPIVATNGNAANPHFAPDANAPTIIRRGDVLLIDFWAKQPGGVYADFTQMAVVDDTVPETPARIFAVVVEARNAAIRFVQKRLRSSQPVLGYEVDDAARTVIEAAGYADAILHRTGHNIGEDVHGEGANCDNFETHDERRLLPGSCCSIEPGIYLPVRALGFRSEVNLLIFERDAVVSGELQDGLPALLA